MIDADLRFGSYVPKVPNLYKDAASLPSSSPASSNHSNKKENEEILCAIGPAWTPLPLLSIKQHNHDTSLFTFSLPNGVKDLNLPTMGHLLVKAPGCEHESAGGGDAIRPYTAVVESSGNDDNPGTFTVMVKLYKEWGQPESKLKHDPNTKCFLFTKTDHSYKPPGAVSNYIHKLNIGDSLEFCFTSDICRGKIEYPCGFDNVSAITMIAVGAGVAPMIRLLRVLLESEGDKRCDSVQKIRLLYGARTADDILMRSTLDSWHELYGIGEKNKADGRFRVRYCVGSRWGNVHFHAKTKKAQGPPLPKNYESIPEDRRALGWVDGEKVRHYGASTPDDEGHRILVCGLPGVYLNLCGPRLEDGIEEDSQLHKLGFKDYQVFKL